MVKIDFAHLSNLEDAGDEQALGEAVMEILRRGDMTPDAQRWLSAHFEPDRGRRERDPNEKPQTKLRLKFTRRNGMKKSNDVGLATKTRHDVFEEACTKFGGYERAIDELVERGKYGGFKWSEATARDCFEAMMATQETE
jgi:hypothetical protein